MINTLFNLEVSFNMAPKNGNTDTDLLCKLLPGFVLLITNMFVLFLNLNVPIKQMQHLKTFPILFSLRDAFVFGGIT